ncbi:MAG: alpha/beta fold hydrolase [Ilumatobacteraceae bacterium]|jgi:pimeloyl-ACP methyl ester carboxylesterase
MADDAVATGIWSEAAGDVEADPVVVVHGSMDRAAGLLRLSRRLDGEFCVIRYDRRGYGRSAHVGPPWTAAANVQDLADLVEQTVPGRRAAVVGHSYGGNVALALAASRPDLVRGVVVYETPLSWLDWWPGTTAGAAAMGATDPGDAAEAFMRRLVGDEAWERLPASTQQQRRAEGPAMVAELADLRRQAPWRFDDVLVPTLALYGERGRPHHRTAMDHLGEMLPDCRVEMVANCGHAGPHTHAGAVAEPIVRFVRSLGALSVPAARPVPSGD